MGIRSPVFGVRSMPSLWEWVCWWEFCPACLTWVTIKPPLQFCLVFFRMEWTPVDARKVIWVQLCSYKAWNTQVLKHIKPLLVTQRRVDRVGAQVRHLPGSSAHHLVGSKPQTLCSLKATPQRFFSPQTLIPRSSSVSLSADGLASVTGVIFEPDKAMRDSTRG